MKKIEKFAFYFLIAIFLFTTTIAFAAERVYYYHVDPAGTPLAMSDSSGNIVWEADYKPFGEEYDVTGFPENNRMFVGKEKDKETGLHYFGARYMEAKIGRFISPDPAGPVVPMTGKINEIVLLNPQRLNQYAYGLNNPYRYVDPDGRWPEWIHNRLIDAAFSSGKYKLPKNVIAIFQRASARVDEDLSLAGSYKHAMAAPNQSAQEAERFWRPNKVRQRRYTYFKRAVNF